jgi:hypothetical protein
MTSHQQTETEFLNLVNMHDSFCRDPEEARKLIQRHLGQELTSAFDGHYLCGRPTTIPEAVHFNVTVRIYYKGE